MTLRLILIRHAKSTWDDPMQEDHDRPLNDRGRRAAPAIGAWLADKGYVPAEVVSSTARRTLETWESMQDAFVDDGALVRREPDLYHAAPDTMLRVLRHCAASPVLMLGHNPGIGALASHLVAERPGHSRFGAYPTCATLVVDFDADDWDHVTPGTGTVVDFIVPADLGIK